MAGNLNQGWVETPLKPVLDALEGNIAVLDAQGNITMVNQAWIDFGLKNGMDLKREWIGTNYLEGSVNLETQPNEEVHSAYEGIRAVLAGQQDSFETEYPYHHHDRKCWFHMHVKAFHHDGCVWAVVVHQDITLRKRAELAWQSSEFRFRNLFQNAAFGIVICRLIRNEEGRVTDLEHLEVNAATQKQTGIDPVELIGKRASDIGSPQEIARPLQIYRQVVETGVPGSFMQYFPVYDRTLDVGAFPIEGDLIALTFIDISDSVRAQNACQRSERRLIEAQRIAKMGDFTWDVQTGEVTWSEALFELLRYEKSEPVDFAKVNTDIHHPDDLERVTQWLHQCIESGSTELSPNEYRLICKDGETIDVRTVGVIERGADQSVRVFGTVQDITDHERAEKALQESENRFQYAMEATTDGLYDWNIQTNEIYFNPGYFTMLGYEPDELPHTFETYEGLVHPEDAERSAQKLSHYLSTGEGDNSIEMRFRSKSGLWMWMLSRGKIVEYDEEGKPLRFVGTNVNIDTIKRQEDALRFEKARAQQYLDVAGVMLIALDAEQKVTQINPKGCEVLGYPQEEILGHNWFDKFLPEGNIAEVKAVYDRIMSGDIEPVEYYENPIVRKDGGQRIIAWHNSILHDHTGRIVGLFSSGEDVTERINEKQRVQEELDKVRNELVRSTRLAAIGQVSASIAHDLRNPLGAVHNATYLLNRHLGHPSEDISRQLDIIEKEVDRSNLIITNLLDLARAKDPVKQEIGLLVVIQEVFDENDIPSGIDCHVDIEPRQLYVCADRNQLKQVIQNILVNAFEAMDDRGRFEVTARQDREHVNIWFRDTGPGLPEALDGSLFEPLVTTKTTGTGLGLTICRDIVTRHQGVISSANHPELGAEIRVSLPCS